MNDHRTDAGSQLTVPLIAMLLVSAVDVALVSLRIARTGDLRYFALIWNLFLAWLPLMFALGVYRRIRRGERWGWRVCALGLLWLLFLPDAPYIFTDLIHLSTRFFPRFWVDLTLVLLVALTGFMLGFLSLYLMQTLVAGRFGKLAGWLFILCASGLSSCGIFLGRFLRWNSWDVVVHPVGLSRDLILLALHSRGQPHSMLFLVSLATFLFLGYLMLYALTHLRPVTAGSVAA